MAEAMGLADPLLTSLPRCRPGCPATQGVCPLLLSRRALSAVEVPAEAVTRCAYCSGGNLGRWGKSRRALQRWRCRSCGRSFTAATGTVLARVHSLDKLRAVAADMLARAPASCRQLAAKLGLDRMTVWRWRRLVAAAWADRKSTFDGAGRCGAASATLILRESRKASREWVQHQRNPARHPAPDRLRWIDYRMLELPLPQPMARYRVVVRLDTQFGRRGDVRADSEGCLRPVETPLRQPAACPTFSATCSAHTDERAILDQRCRAVRSTRPPRCAAGQQAKRHAAGAIMLVEQLRHFMKPFRGPATRHLQTYRTWFAARLVAPGRC
jgi:transposase-like protein